MARSSNLIGFVMVMDGLRKWEFMVRRFAFDPLRLSYCVAVVAAHAFIFQGSFQAFKNGTGTEHVYLLWCDLSLTSCVYLIIRYGGFIYPAWSKHAGTFSLPCPYFFIRIRVFSASVVDSDSSIHSTISIPTSARVVWWNAVFDCSAGVWLTWLNHANRNQSLYHIHMINTY